MTVGALQVGLHDQPEAVHYDYEQYWRSFAVSLGLSHGVIDLHHLRCSGALERDRPLSRNSAALLRLVTFLTHHRFPR